MTYEDLKNNFMFKPVLDEFINQIIKQYPKLSVKEIESEVDIIGNEILELYTNKLKEFDVKLNKLNYEKQIF